MAVSHPANFDEDVSRPQPRLTITQETPHASSSGQGDSTEARVDSITKIELPPFWIQSPDFWFAAVEAQFFDRRITADNIKYYAVVSRLNFDALTIVQHIVRAPPAVGKFEALKTALVNHFSVSQEQRFRKLASGLHLGEKKPSMLLLEMLNLSEGSLDDAFVRTLWLDHLPQFLQVALASASSLSTTELGQLADKIHDIPKHVDSHRVMASSTSSASQTSTLEEQMKRLNVRLNRLEKQLSCFRSRSRQRSKTPEPSEIRCQCQEMHPTVCMDFDS